MCGLAEVQLLLVLALFDQLDELELVSRPAYGWESGLRTQYDKPNLCGGDCF